jgi:hypothetical protein
MAAPVHDRPEGRQTSMTMRQPSQGCPPQTNDTAPRPAPGQVAMAAAGSQAAWNTVVDTFASLVWRAARRRQLTEIQAVEVCRLSWIRLVDNLSLVSDDTISDWLEATTDRESTRIADLSACCGRAAS